MKHSGKAFSSSPYSIPTLQGPVCVCGHFGEGRHKINGQTIKTLNITEGLCAQLGADMIRRVDTGQGFRSLLSLPFTLGWAACRCRHIVILPAHKGVRIVSPILAFYHLFFRFSVHYMIVGAWLPGFIRRMPVLGWFLRKAVTCFYAETSTLQRQMQELGYETCLLPNFKRLSIKRLSAGDSLVPPLPLRVCTFSRVMKMKGMEDAIEAVSRVNQQMGRTVFDLTIYGPVWPTETVWFEQLQAGFPSYVHYGGVVAASESVGVLTHYFFMLFPTRFFTEGVPGTFIDAYAAGLPVVASSWESVTDVLIEGRTGYAYPFGDVDALVALLLRIARQPELITRLRTHCVSEALRYQPEQAIRPFIQRLLSAEE